MICSSKYLFTVKVKIKKRVSSATERKLSLILPKIQMLIQIYLSIYLYINSF